MRARDCSMKLALSLAVLGVYSLSALPQDPQDYMHITFGVDARNRRNAILGASLERTQDEVLGSLVVGGISS